MDLPAADKSATKPTEKKKKRRSRKKRSSQREPTAHTESDPILLPQPPVIMQEARLELLPLSLRHYLSQNSPLSPRKQTLLRHKISDTSFDEPLFISEVKQLKKNRKPQVQAQVAVDADEKFGELLSGQSMAGKAIVFRSKMARISVFHEQVVDHSASASGTLLGHGELTIFQLHNGDITYLACGASFVYPLFPKLKILRVDRTHFILPLVNPQRYWKIEIDGCDDIELSKLESLFQNIVNYTTLYLELESLRAGHVDLQSDKAALDSNADGINHYSRFFSAIPDSPPLAPVSPQQLNLYDSTLSFLPTRNQASQILDPSQLNLKNGKAAVFLPTLDPKQHSRDLGNTRTFTQAVAAPIAKTSIPQKLFTTQEMTAVSSLSQRPTDVHANPYKKEPHADSDTSSMDLLLDEFEENISINKSVDIHMTHAPSHARSHVSISHEPMVRYAGSRQFVLPDRSLAGSSYGGYQHNKVEEDPFPATSLSQYNYRRPSQSGRSRQSSVSELYTSVSNWMEPGAGAPKLTHSRSNYTLGSLPGASRPVNVRETYRDIYRSITLQDIPGRAAREMKHDTRHYSKLMTTENFDLQQPQARVLELKQSRLSSAEVFELLSRREEKTERPSGLGRFFGW